MTHIILWLLIKYNLGIKCLFHYEFTATDTIYLQCLASHSNGFCFRNMILYSFDYLIYPYYPAYIMGCYQISVFFYAGDVADPYEIGGFLVKVLPQVSLSEHLAGTEGLSVDMFVISASVDPKDSAEG